MKTATYIDYGWQAPWSPFYPVYPLQMNNPVQSQAPCCCRSCTGADKGVDLVDYLVIAVQTMARAMLVAMTWLVQLSAKLAKLMLGFASQLFAAPRLAAPQPNFDALPRCPQ